MLEAQKLKEQYVKDVQEYLDTNDTKPIEHIGELGSSSEVEDSSDDDQETAVTTSAKTSPEPTKNAKQPVKVQSPAKKAPVVSAPVGTAKAKKEKTAAPPQTAVSNELIPESAEKKKKRKKKKVVEVAPEA